MIKRFSMPLTEQGFILTLTLILLLIATVIGITAVTTSKTDVGMSGNFKLALQAFYTTDSVTQYVLTNPTTFDMTNYAAPLAVFTIADNSLPTGFTGNANVTFLSTALPPPGTSSKYFSSNYFVITTTATGPANSQNTQIMNWAEVVPKS